MSVKVDYLVVCSHSRDLKPILAKLLGDVIETAYNEEDIDYEPPEDEELRQCIALRYTKNREGGHQIYSFAVDFDIASVEFDIASEEMEKLIYKFSKAVRDCKGEGIKHLLKLHDPHLQRTLHDYGKDIFEIEMKLREVLSLIFVDTCGTDFYDLLKETDVTPRVSLTPKEMCESYENQFFCLLFSQYKELKVRNSIIERQYVNFLDSLDHEVGPIEDLRNCVAHNRSIPQITIDNYKESKEQLLNKINQFLKELAEPKLKD